MLRTLAVTALVLGVLAIPSGGSAARTDGPVEEAARGSSDPAATTIELPDGLVDVSLQGMPAVEGDRLTFVLTITGSFSDPIQTVMFTAGKGEDLGGSATATSDVDYAYTRRSHTFRSPGQFAIEVPAFDDSAVEGDEYFKVIAASTGAFPPVIFDLRVEGWIIDNDRAPTPELAFDDVSVPEGNTGTTSADFTLSLSPAADRDVEVEYSTCGAGCRPEATADSQDYAARRETIVFAPGETAKTIPVTIYGDTVVEDDEFFYINVLDVTNAGVADPIGVGTILNDDTAAPPALSIDDVAMTEGDAGTTTAVFTVTLTPTSTSLVTVDYSTCGVGCNAAATAEKGEDYEMAKGTLTFSPGQSVETVAVTIYGDVEIEPDEVYYVNLLDPVGATRARKTGVGTILNDDTGSGPPTCNGQWATIWGDGLLVGTGAHDVIVGGAGPDEIRGNGGDDLICGGDGADTIIGGPGNDVMFGEAGDDLIKGLPGDDTAYGGGGDDRIQGNAGADVLDGEDGKDKLWGGIGPDLLSGGAGNDQLHGNAGGDGLVGGPGTDRMWGDAGDDSLLGYAQSDFLYGGIGADTLEGGLGNDRLFGWHDDDLLYGNEGRDQLRGQNGDDLVDGGPDHDWCSVETVMIDCEQPL
jgi:Ca2+-binding RTX toxin-like protein